MNETNTVLVEPLPDGFAATLNDGRMIKRADLEQLGAALAALGYEPEDVRTVDWRQDFDRSLTGGQRIALMVAMRSMRGDGK